MLTTYKKYNEGANIKFCCRPYTGIMITCVLLYGADGVSTAEMKRMHSTIHRINDLEHLQSALETSLFGEHIALRTLCIILTCHLKNDDSCMGN